MKRNFDKFLLGLLWLMTVALALTFWMNIKYGFNVLSGAHWQYLSSLQAARATIKPEFYISLIIGIFVGIFGMYLLMRPRPIQTPKVPVSEPPTPAQEKPITNVSSTTISARPKPPSVMRTVASSQQYRPGTTKNILSVPEQKKNDNPLESEISKTFELSEYIVKPCKKLGRLINPVVALGYDNTVWIGTSNTSLMDVQDAIQTLIAIFDDTLGETANDMSLRGCVINSTNSGNDYPDLISTFNNIDEFSEFMKQHQNEKPADFDQELFEAVSTYITTVIGYAGKS